MNNYYNIQYCICCAKKHLLFQDYPELKLVLTQMFHIINQTVVHPSNGEKIIYFILQKAQAAKIRF